MIIFKSGCVKRIVYNVNVEREKKEENIHSCLSALASELIERETASG